MFVPYVCMFACLCLHAYVCLSPMSVCLHVYVCMFACLCMFVPYLCLYVFVSLGTLFIPLYLLFASFTVFDAKFWPGLVQRIACKGFGSLRHGARL